jgi:hypothetical protein
MQSFSMLKLVRLQGPKGLRRKVSVEVKLHTLLKSVVEALSG